MSYDSLLRDRATFYSPTRGKDAVGGQTLTWAAVASNVPCRLEVNASAPGTGATDLSGHKRSVAGKEGIVAGWQLWINPPSIANSWSATEAMRVEVGGRTYEIEYVEDYQRLQRVMVLYLSEVR